MVQSATSTIINRPAAEIFAVLDEFNRDPEWRPAVRAVRKTSQGPAGLGATYVEERMMFGRRMEGPVVVTEYEPGRVYAFQRASGPVRPIGSYTLEPAGAGTRVTFTLRVPAHGVWVAATPLLALLARGIARGAAGELARLKRLLERAPASIA